jgi:cyclophilin family peptidyl-prolyl cis-trans isomerase
LQNHLKKYSIIFTIVFLLSGCAAQVQQGQSGQPGAGADQEKQTQWDQPPELTIDDSNIYLATLTTERGEIKIELFADRVPVTVNNFIFLAEEGYYDGTTFHRVLPNFMAQGGDISGTGGGGPGYEFEDEFNPTLTFDDQGYLAMANGGPNTNGSQFFITFAPTPHLNGLHTIFGKVVEGMDVVLSLTLRDPGQSPDFEGDILEEVTIEVISESLLPPPPPTPIPVVPVPESGRPLADLDIFERENLYTGIPAMIIDVSAVYEAHVTTNKGEFTILLDPIAAPESVNNFVVLAELGYYDGFPINFADQEQFLLTGSPFGDPSSDIGYIVPSETGLENKAAAVGFWFRQDRFGSSGSQFYVLYTDQPMLDDVFTVFGEVVEGMEVVETLTQDDQIEIISIVTR